MFKKIFAQLGVTPNCGSKTGPERLADEVWLAIETMPVFAEERAWAMVSRPTLAKRAGVSETTIRNWLKKPPFRTTTKMMGGKKRLLIRIGDDQTPEDLARIMRHEFDKRFPRENVSQWQRKREFGCLRWLAVLWSEMRPDLFPPAIFRSVIPEWPTFNVAVHGEIDAGIVEAEEADEEPDLYHLKKGYPSIPLIRRFHEIGIEVHIMKLQAEATDTLPF
mgnify:CR=1 FL=1